MLARKRIARGCDLAFITADAWDWLSRYPVLCPFTSCRATKLRRWDAKGWSREAWDCARLQSQKQKHPTQSNIESDRTSSRCNKSGLVSSQALATHPY